MDVDEQLILSRHGADEIRPGLWLGDQDDALMLAAKGFIPVCVLETLPWGEPNKAYWVPILVPQRSLSTELLHWQIGADKASHEQLDLVTLLVGNLLAEGRQVLAHCAAGVERSPLAVAWYLMKKEGLTIDEAYAEIKKKRPFVADRRLWLRRGGHNYIGVVLDNLNLWWNGVD